MDDKKVFELKRLELAYRRQLLFMFGFVMVTLMGIVLYIVNIYHYQFQLLLVAIMLIAIGTIGMLSVDSRMKELSKDIKSL